MILADASVWIAHFRQPIEELQDRASRGDVAMHPFILGELALGHLPQRSRTLSILFDLFTAPVASHDEVMQLITSHDLSGRGIGYVDLHLLASALLQPGLRLWTRDRRLRECAEVLGAGFFAPGAA